MSAANYRPSPGTTGYTVNLTQCSDNLWVPIDSLAKTYGNDGTNITTAVVSYCGVTYTQTYTFSGGICTAVSRWVAS